MPRLELEPALFMPPRGYTLDVLGGHMLFPDEADRRADYENAMLLQGLLAETGSPVQSTDSLRAALALATLTPPITQLREQVVTPMQYGFIAGEILLTTVCSETLKITYKLTVLKLKIAKDTGRSVSTIDNIALKRFRTVSHYFAASRLLYGAGEHRFPCNLADLAVWLAFAEHLRAIAERIVPPRQTRHFLEVGEALTFAHPLPLPKAAIIGAPAVGRTKDEISQDVRRQILAAITSAHRSDSDVSAHE